MKNKLDIQELQKEISLLPVARNNSPWAKHRNALSARIMSGDIDKFCNWSTIRATMFVGDVPFIHQEFDEIRESNDWARWELALRESSVGSPTMFDRHVLTSTNRINQCYNLLFFEKISGIHIEDLEGPIVEFGGGYGLMCSVIRKLGYSGRYIIYDFPEFCLLQSYYLHKNGYEAEFFSVDDSYRFKVPPSDCDMFIGLHSISEAPVEMRNAFMMSITSRYCLVAYNSFYDGVDNKMFFSKARSMVCDATIINSHPYIKNSYYLIGYPNEE